jgi:hypothetical protein
MFNIVAGAAGVESQHRSGSGNTVVTLHAYIWLQQDSHVIPVTLAFLVREAAVPVP